MSQPIHLDAPNLGDLEKTYLIKAVDSGYVSTAGPFVPEFETKFAGYLGSPACVSVQSGTAAIHLALYELGIGPGDEVIVPAITFIASVNPIIYQGATPVFVDIDPATWNLDPSQVEAAITSKTKAILPVHLYGNPCNMEALGNIAKRHQLFIVEDATESLGATYRGKFTGTFGEMGCFSFNGNKVITTGGGGMITAQNPERGTHLKFLANQARDVSKGYYHPEIGFNYRMTNLEAALGLAQMERLSEFLAQKRKFYQIYQETFSGISQIQMQQIMEDCISSAWMSSVKINTVEFRITIPEIQAALADLGVVTRRIFQPVVDFPPYQQFKTTTYHNSDELFENGLNLPSSTLNAEKDIQYSAESLLKVLGINKR